MSNLAAQEFSTTGSLDEASERAIKKLEREIQEIRDREKYKATTPYEQRVKDFKKFAMYSFCDPKLKKTSFTFESSYKRPGYPPLPRITFSWHDLKKFFYEDEDHPCLLKGSIAAMRAEQRARDYHNAGTYHFVYEVFERYVRKRKMTVVNSEEWYKYTKKGGGVRILERIIQKAGGGFCERRLSHEIAGMVDERHRVCLIKGKKYYFGNEAAWAVTQELFEHAKKAERILRRLT